MRSTFVLLLVIGSVLAEDWPRFRGPNGAGTSSDKRIPVEWSSDHVLFKTRLQGVGHGSPIIVKDRVFLLSATPMERTLFCFNAINGKELWKKSVEGKTARKHAKSSFASSTPVAEGDRVFCVFWDGESVFLHAYDFLGKQLWQADLGPFSSQHGPGFSPVIVDGKVIVNNDQDGSAELIAFDAATGKKRWVVERRAFRSCYSTPITIQSNQGKLLVVTSTAGITAYHPDDGKVIWNYVWSFTGMPLRTVGSSVSADGLVFGCAGDGSGERSMIAVKLDGKGDVTNSHLVWAKSLNRATPYVPSVLAYRQHLYGVLDEGQAICLEASTGKEVWKRRLTGNVSSSPILIDGKVYVADERGEVIVFKADPSELTVLGRNKVGELIMATPAVANDRLYLRGEKHLICIGLRNKE